MMIAREARSSQAEACAIGGERMSDSGTTLTRHLLIQPHTPVPASDLLLIMEQVTLAAKLLSNELSRASLTGELGYTGTTNVQGERVKKLDTFANQVFLDVFASGQPVCTLVSEEMDEPRHLKSNCCERSYAILYDPIDGSSNSDVNGALGTIFAVRRRARDHSSSFEDLLRPGVEQIAAGYVLYGPSTILTYTCGAGVHAYALDHGVGEFFLWRENIAMPQRGVTYAVNEAHQERWHPGARRLVENLRNTKPSGYSLRYAGSFTADFHRSLLEGGIYMYPSEVTPGGKPGGKLRLMYEVAPLSMVAEAAGGRASTGKGRALDVVPSEVHARVPIYIGSAEEVAIAERLHVED
jgi:fructose-1,6-bisphosphatase I